MACARVRYSGPLLSLAPRTIRHFGRQVRAVACEILQFCRPGGHLVLGRGSCRARGQAVRVPELALHGDCEGLLTFTAAPISRQLTRPYSRSMTDEAPPPQRGDELASQAGLRASHVDRDRTVELLRVAAGDGRLTAEELDQRLETALTARTYGELAALTTDLPAIPDSAPARRSRSRRTWPASTAMAAA